MLLTKTAKIAFCSFGRKLQAECREKEKEKIERRRTVLMLNCKLSAVAAAAAATFVQVAGQVHSSHSVSFLID